MYSMFLNMFKSGAFNRCVSSYFFLYFYILCQGWEYSSVVEHFPSMGKALSSVPRPAQTNFVSSFIYENDL